MLGCEVEGRGQRLGQVGELAHPDRDPPPVRPPAPPGAIALPDPYIQIRIPFVLAPTDPQLFLLAAGAGRQPPAGVLGRVAIGGRRWELVAEPRRAAAEVVCLDLSCSQEITISGIETVERTVYNTGYSILMATLCQIEIIFIIYIYYIY